MDFENEMKALDLLSEEKKDILKALDNFRIKTESGKSIKTEWENFKRKTILIDSKFKVHINSDLEDQYEK